MTARLARTRRTPRLVVAIVAVLAVAFLAAIGASARTGGGERKVIAEASSNGLRVEVTAVKVDGPHGEPPAATVKVAAFERSSGEWRQLGSALTVGDDGSWFWRVVTRPYGVRKLVLARVGGSRFPERIGLKLLVSPSVGPSGTFRFTLQDGRLVAVDV
jgi:hypothetical protein